MHLFARLCALITVGVLVGCAPNSANVSKPSQFLEKKDTFSNSNLRVTIRSVLDQNVVASMGILAELDGRAEVDLLDASSAIIGHISATGSFTKETVLGGPISFNCAVRTAVLRTFVAAPSGLNGSVRLESFSSEEKFGDDVYPSTVGRIGFSQAPKDDIVVLISDGDSSLRETYPVRVPAGQRQTEVAFTRFTEHPNVQQFSHYEMTACGLKVL
jgi:hypothetical protein